MVVWEKSKSTYNKDNNCKQESFKMMLILAQSQISLEWHIFRLLQMRETSLNLEYNNNDTHDFITS